MLTDTRYTLIMPLQSFSLYHDQLGYGSKSGPPGPISSDTVIRLAGTPCSLIEVTNILPSTKIAYYSICLFNMLLIQYVLL